MVVLLMNVNFLSLNFEVENTQIKIKNHKIFHCVIAIKTMLGVENKWYVAMVVREKEGKTKKKTEFAKRNNTSCFFILTEQYAKTVEGVNDIK